MRDVRDKKRKKLIRAYTEMVCQRIMLSWPLIIDINVKNIKNDKNLREIAAPQKVDTERWKTDGK